MATLPIRRYYPARVQCPECSTVQTIWRHKLRARPAGHRKRLWCYVCRAERNHVELERAQSMQEEVG